ncbi:MAG: DUF29 family protein [Cyanobacteriota bacterium]|nr:DUF29 family protein [Cyanobacteriota bacterium]
MIQELIDLRQSIIEGRTDDALEIIDDLEGMGRKSLLRNIKSYLVRMLIHLIKNEVEGRLTNSWAASIRESVLEIQDLNLMENKKSRYIKPEEWDELLELAFDDAIAKSSGEIYNGAYKPFQLWEMVDVSEIMRRANLLISLTYSLSEKDLRAQIYEEFSRLPGGEDWIVERES